MVEPIEAGRANRNNPGDVELTVRGIIGGAALIYSGVSSGDKMPVIEDAEDRQRFVSLCSASAAVFGLQLAAGNIFQEFHPSAEIFPDLGTEIGVKQATAISKALEKRQVYLNDYVYNSGSESRLQIEALSSWLEAQFRQNPVVAAQVVGHSSLLTDLAVPGIVKILEENAAVSAENRMPADQVAAMVEVLSHSPKARFNSDAALDLGLKLIFSYPDAGTAKPLIAHLCREGMGAGFSLDQLSTGHSLRITPDIWPDKGPSGADIVTRNSQPVLGKALLEQARGNAPQVLEVLLKSYADLAKKQETDRELVVLPHEVQSQGRERYNAGRLAVCLLRDLTFLAEQNNAPAEQLLRQFWKPAAKDQVGNFSSVLCFLFERSRGDYATELIRENHLSPNRLQDPNRFEQKTLGAIAQIVSWAVKTPEVAAVAYESLIDKHIFLDQLLVSAAVSSPVIEVQQNAKKTFLKSAVPEGGVFRAHCLTVSGALGEPAQKVGLESATSIARLADIQGDVENYLSAIVLSYATGIGKSTLIPMIDGKRPQFNKVTQPEAVEFLKALTANPKFPDIVSKLFEVETGQVKPRQIVTGLPDLEFKIPGLPWRSLQSDGLVIRRVEETVGLVSVAAALLEPQSVAEAPLRKWLKLADVNPAGFPKSSGVVSPVDARFSENRALKALVGDFVQQVQPTSELERKAQRLIRDIRDWFRREVA